jgi:hypothetical protein
MTRKVVIAVSGLLLIAAVVALFLFAASGEQNVQPQREGTLRMILQTNAGTMVRMLPTETPRQFKTQASP